MSEVDITPPGGSDDDDDVTRGLLRRAASAVEVGPAPSPAHVLVGPRSAGRRGRFVLAVAAAVAVLAVVVLRPWDGDGSRGRVVADGGSTTITTTANLPPPMLGRAEVTGADMDGLRPPAVSVPDVSATEGPSGELLLPAAWTFTPPAGWTGGDTVRLAASGSGGAITGFAESPDGRRSVVAFTSIPGVTAPPGAPGVVQAKDGSPWTLRTVDVDGEAVVAFSVDRDGHAAILFTGLSPTEWTAVLDATASAVPGAPGFDGGVYGGGPAARIPGLPADLAGRWRPTRSVSQTLELPGPDGRRYTIEVATDTAPDALVQRTAGASGLVWDPTTSRILATECAGSVDVVCARTTRATGGVVLGAFVTAWRDGTRIDVTVRVDPSGPPVDPQQLLDEMGQVAGSLSPAT